jgi:hypothetical protein
MLTLLLWYWRGWRPVYTSTDVHASAALFRKHLPDGSRILCVTDQKLHACCRALLDGVVQLPADPFAGVRGVRPCTPMASWVRMNQCNAEWLHSIGVSGPVMSVDMDSVAVADLSPLLSPPEAIKWQALRSASARLNPSVLWQREPGVLQGAWDNMTLAAVRAIPRHIIGSDQAWLSWWRHTHQTPTPMLLDRSHGVYQYAVKLCDIRRRPALPRLWTFAGSRKQWDRVTRFGLSAKAHVVWRDTVKACRCA